MLIKFCVENFKSFKGRFVFDLSNSGNYEFGKECVENGIIRVGAIYGINGIGKSNFGLALFDIVNHLTFKMKEKGRYSPFLNLNSGKSYATFEYTFSFLNHKFVYRYEKKDIDSILEESISVDDKEMLFYDFRERKGFSRFRGTEHLNLDDGSSNSRVQFIMNVSILDESDESVKTFVCFKKFVNNMLLFYSLRDNGFIGFKDYGCSIDTAIVKAGKLKEFETLLKEQGLDVSLSEIETEDGKHVGIKYENGVVPYFRAASTGMISLMLFYSWYVLLDGCSLIFVDEFDAFYHYELAEIVVKMLKKIPNAQVVLTTHNTDLLSNDLLRPDCYFILDEKKIAPLNELTDKEIRFAHNLQKMFKGKAFVTE